jgi:pimeloyl-ACP methyl ester carboxylesterase
MHLAEQGEGPLVVLCHGFPESWYSWRHQLWALAEAGFHAVAPDMRGYGQTDKPAAIDQYTLLYSIGDVVGLLDALGAEQAVIAGHDWGAPLAWAAAVLRPDRFRAVIALSGPFGPRAQSRPTTAMPQKGDMLFYQLYFQTPGVAEAEFERDVRLTIRTMLYSASGDAPRLIASVVDRDAVGMVHRERGFLSPRALDGSCPRAPLDVDPLPSVGHGSAAQRHGSTTVCPWEMPPLPSPLPRRPGSCPGTTYPGRDAGGAIVSLRQDAGRFRHRRHR